MTKNLFIKTYGCQMNVYDSDRMAEILEPLGYAECPSVEDADLIVLNTCHIREKAAEKMYSELGRLAVIKKTRAEPMLIAVAGCVAQAEGGEIMRRAPAVDIVVGPQSYHRLADIVARAARTEEHKAESGIIDTEFPAESKFDYPPLDIKPKGVTAFLTVQEGCDKFCTFCVVPYTRGAEFSRPFADVTDEAKRLVARGVREVTLLGQNVNAFHGVDESGTPAGLARLIRRLAEVEGLERIRYTTSHPRDMDDELIAAHRDITTLMPFIHLPVQSGSDDVLRAMNRRHRIDDYLSVIGKLRSARPDIAVSSDFIVGFPGETDADFEATLDLVRGVGFAQSFSFKFSARPGTPAAEIDAQVPEELKEQRLQRLQALLNEQQRTFNGGCVNQTLSVLFEKAGRHPGQLVGRSPYLQPVHVTAGDRLIGSQVDVHIEAALANSLSGRLAGSTLPLGAPNAA